MEGRIDGILEGMRDGLIDGLLEVRALFRKETGAILPAPKRSIVVTNITKRTAAARVAIHRTGSALGGTGDVSVDGSAGDGVSV